MSRPLMMSAAAITALALAACSDSGSNAGQDLANPGDSPMANTVQDMAAGPVGMASAMTANSPEDYVRLAAIGDLYEVEAGRIAATRATRDDVKAFANMMVEHHTKNTEDLKKVLSDNTINITPPTQLDNRRAGMIQNLRAAEDDAFDMVYLHQQLAAHLEAQTLHGRYAEDGDNVPLRTAATLTKPVVDGHLERVKEIGGDALERAMPD